MVVFSFVWDECTVPAPRLEMTCAVVRGAKRVWTHLYVISIAFHTALVHGLAQGMTSRRASETQTRSHAGQQSGCVRV